METKRVNTAMPMGRSAMRNSGLPSGVSGRDAICLLDKLIQETGPHYYVGDRVLQMTDPEGYKLKKFEICYILGLTYKD